jgi:hypothetical protein
MRVRDSEVTKVIWLFKEERPNYKITSKWVRSENQRQLDRAAIELVKVVNS